MSTIWSNVTEHAIASSIFENKGGGKNHSNERFVKRWTQPIHEAVKDNFSSSQATGGGLTRRRKKQNKTKSNTRSRNQSGGFLRAGHRYYYTPQLSNPPVTQLQDNMPGMDSPSY